VWEGTTHLRSAFHWETVYCHIRGTGLPECAPGVFRYKCIQCQVRSNLHKGLYNNTSIPLRLFRFENLHVVGLECVSRGVFERLCTRWYCEWRRAKFKAQLTVFGMEPSLSEGQRAAFNEFATLLVFSLCTIRSCCDRIEVLQHNPRAYSL
jgi:hypothetical protein